MVSMRNLGLEISDAGRVPVLTGDGLSLGGTCRQICPPGGRASVVWASLPSDGVTELGDEG